MSSRRSPSKTVTSVTRVTSSPAIVTVVKKAKKRSRRNRRRASRTQAPRMPSDVALWLATLSDPFEHGPIRMGWGTFHPTGLGTAFYRGTISSSSTDGSFAIGLFPFLNAAGTGQSAIVVQNTNASSTTWGTSLDFINKGAFNGVANQLRAVSYGLKVYPQVPLTSAPGILYCGTIPAASASSLTANSVNNLAGSPYLKVGYGNVGAMVSGRPEDPTSFEVSNYWATLAAPTTPSNWGTCIVAGTGFPNSTNIIIEAVMNFEFFYSSSVSSTLLESPLEGGPEADASLSSLFPSVEAMWNFVKSRLPSAAITDSISNLAERGASAAIRAAAATLTSRRSTGSRGGLMPRLAAAGAAASSSLYQNIFGSASTGYRDRLMATEYVEV
jgi:hypothetical protein